MLHASHNQHEAPEANRDGKAMRGVAPRMGNPVWEMISYAFRGTLFRRLRSPLHDLNAASAPGKGPRLAALRPHQDLAGSRCPHSPAVRHEAGLQRGAAPQGARRKERQT